MDIWPFIFAACLVLASLLVAAAAFSDRAGGAGASNDPRAARQRQIKAQREMERRRERVWWKLEEMYAEFMVKTGGDPVAALPPAADTVAPSRGPSAREVGGDDFTVAGLEEAYEAFLRGKRAG